MRWHRPEDAIPIGRRRTTRLPGYDYGRRGHYFVTIRAANQLFGYVEGSTVRLNALGQIVEDCWRAIPDHSRDVCLDSFIVMPDHIHGILLLDGHSQHAIGRITPGCLGAIIRSFKSAATAKINQRRGTVSARVWQRNYYEHIVRSSEDLDQIRHYIMTNPQRWKRSNKRELPERQ